MKRAYLIRLDDIAPNMNWEAYFRIKEMLKKYRIKPIAGVIADNQDPELKKFPSAPLDFWAEIRELQCDGWAIAMHGFQHVYDSRSPNVLGMKAKSEFAGHSFDVQLQKLRAAQAIFDREGIRPKLFFAPSHSFDLETLRALREIGLTDVSDGYALFPFEKCGVHFIPQLIGRPFAFPLGVFTSALHLNYFREHDFQELEAFLKKHSRHVVTFEEARNYESNRVFNRMSGKAIEWALKSKRAILNA